MKIKSEWCHGCQLVKKQVLLASLTVFLTGGVAAIVSLQEVKLESYQQVDGASSIPLQDSKLHGSSFMHHNNEQSTINNLTGEGDDFPVPSAGDAASSSPSVDQLLSPKPQVIARVVHDVDDITNK